MQLIATSDFINAASSKGSQAFQHLPNVELTRFKTKDDFYRPSNSEFINSFTDLNGKKVRFYTFNLSKSILVLSDEPGSFGHSIYTTTRKDGFFLSEVFDLMAIYGF